MSEKVLGFKVLNLFRELRTDAEKQVAAKNSADVWLSGHSREDILGGKDKRLAKEIELAKKGKWSAVKLRRNLEQLHRIFVLIESKQEGKEK